MNYIKLSNDFIQALEKKSALKSRVDAELETLINQLMILARITNKNLKYLSALKSQYIINFDPALEQTIIDLAPKIQLVIAKAEKSMNDIHAVINGMLSRTEENISSK